MGGGWAVHPQFKACSVQAGARGSTEQPCARGQIVYNREVKVRVKGKKEEDACKGETRERGRRGRVLVAIDLSSHSVSVYGALLTLTPCVPVSAAFPLPPVEAGTASGA